MKRDEWALMVKATTVLEAARARREKLTGEAAQQMLFYERWLESVGPRAVWIDLDDVRFFGIDLEKITAEFPGL